MNTDPKDTSKTGISSAADADIKIGEDESQIEALNQMQDDITRNDTIPETSRTTPGSNGAFPVGAFENSKD